MSARLRNGRWERCYVFKTVEGTRRVWAETFSAAIKVIQAPGPSQLRTAGDWCEGRAPSGEIVRWAKKQGERDLVIVRDDLARKASA